MIPKSGNRFSEKIMRKQNVRDTYRLNSIRRHSPMQKLIIQLLLFIALGSSAAHAHAFLDHASPLVGSTVASAPRELALTFTQNLEAAFSSVQVTDANGGRVDSGKPQITGNTMRVGLKSLPQGTYRVRWHVLSVDTHKTEGSFTFHVGGP
jgi:methionine-rich copper-binding protein CopC